MELNKLSYQIIVEKDELLPDLWIELLIDEKPISDLLKTENKAIPFWDFENELPTYFNYYKNKRVCSLGVCSCGDSGCGETGCVMEKGKDFVGFSEIFNDGFEFPKDFEFRFSRENYDSVIAEIIKLVNKHKKANENK